VASFNRYYVLMYSKSIELNNIVGGPIERLSGAKSLVFSDHFEPPVQYRTTSAGSETRQLEYRYID
jgi:hypothetical protein